MSFILRDGKRCYLNDATGEVTVDNVSAEEARSRARQAGNADPPAPIRTVQPVQPVRSSRAVQPERPGRLLRLFHNLLRGAAAAVAVCSLLTIGAYCMTEPVRFGGSYHFELRDTADVVAQLEQIGEELVNILTLEGRDET